MPMQPATKMKVRNIRVIMYIPYAAIDCIDHARVESMKNVVEGSGVC